MQNNARVSAEVFRMGSQCAAVVTMEEEEEPTERSGCLFGASVSLATPE